MKRLKMILLPGMDGTGKLFDPLLETLPPNFEPRVIAYPNEPVKSYDELLPQVQRELPNGYPFLIVAESFSGPLAIKLAAIQPANLEALILCATFAENPLPALNWIHSFVSPLFFRLPPPRILIRHLLAGANCSKALVDRLLEIARSIKPEVIASRIRLVLTVDETQDLKSCRVPILYLIAKQDRLVSRRYADQVLRLNPQAKCVEIDAPHLLLQTEPEKAIIAINTFLRSQFEE